MSRLPAWWMLPSGMLLSMARKALLQHGDVFGLEDATIALELAIPRPSDLLSGLDYERLVELEQDAKKAVARTLFVLGYPIEIEDADSARPD